MKLEAVLNDFMEIEYFESKEKNGTVSKETTINPSEDFFHISEVICDRDNVIYSNKFVIDKELLSALNEIIKEYNL